LGYESCGRDSREENYEKVALYADSTKVTHAARQLLSKWTNKLGREIDITHTLEGLAGGVYGEVVQILRRLVTEA